MDTFLSTPSARRATDCPTLRAKVAEFLSTPSARRATSSSGVRKSICLKFLSTPSARRATHRRRPEPAVQGHFYPRPPRGGRPALYLFHRPRIQISIHALREEGDTFPQAFNTADTRFLSTPSARRATVAPIFYSWYIRFLSTPSARRATRDMQNTSPDFPISIHALREEGDVRKYADVVKNIQFLSTPSARRATQIAAI